MDLNLVDQEIQAIASLKEHFGFKMLLDRIQAELDNTQMEILDCNRLVIQEKVLFWRALYKIFLIFKTVPEDMEKEMKKLKLEKDYLQLPENIPQEYLMELLKIYQKKKNEQDKI